MWGQIPQDGLTAGVGAPGKDCLLLAPQSLGNHSWFSTWRRCRRTQRALADHARLPALGPSTGVWAIWSQVLGKLAVA
jgi:hypothetical protein